MTQIGSSTAGGSSISRGPLNVPMLALRIVQTVFGLLVLALVGDAVRRETGTFCDGFGDCFRFRAPGTWGYNVFAGVITLLLGLYLIAANFVPKISHTVISLGINVFGILVWFSAFVSLAAWLGINTNGQGDGGFTVLQQLEAACVFGGLTWLTFIATLVLGLKDHKKGGSTSISTGAPMQSLPQQNPVGVAAHPNQTV